MHISDLNIEVHNSVDSVEADLQWLESEGLSTPFQSRAWLLPFYKVLAPGLDAAPVIVIVRDKVSRCPMMLFPLCARGAYGVTVIEFADLRVSDYNAPVIAKAFNLPAAQWDDLWNKIVAALDQGSALWLKKMPRVIGGRPNPMIRPGNGVDAMYAKSWGVALPRTLAEYEKRVLHPTFARELGKKMRRIAKRGEVEYAIARTQDEKRAAFDILARQRQARCDDMGRSNIMAQPTYRRFYESLAMDSTGSLVNLTTLKVKGEIVATLFALNHGNALRVLMSTFQSGEWKSCSLGNVIIQMAIEHAIGNGIDFFDLTVGNEPYKQYFGATPSTLYSAVQPITRAGSSVALLISCGAKIKEAAKHSLLADGLEAGKGFHAPAN